MAAIRFGYFTKVGGRVPATTGTHKGHLERGLRKKDKGVM